jgi:transcriptional regulator with XRE-family HTH domain
MPKSSKNATRNSRKGALSPQQSRAARGWLGWSQDELAKQANVALRTVASFERGEQTPRPNNIDAMRRVFEGAGVRLLFDDLGEAAGVGRGDTTGELSRFLPRSRP